MSLPEPAIPNPAIGPSASAPSYGAPDLEPNNFDLLRLLAAAQVVIGHAAERLLGHLPYVFVLIGEAPGVPVFFFISGFLISASWERNPDLKTFAVNRFLRIMPGLAAVTVFSLVAILLFAHLPLAQAWPKLALWFVAQLTLLSDWNPGFLRHYGTGVVNGSLWTIPIEVCFYIATPLLYWLMRKSGRAALVLTAAIALSFFCEYFLFGLVPGRHPTFWKVFAYTPVPWFGMFVLGLVAQRNLKRLLPIVAGRALHFGVLCLAVMVLTTFWRLPPLLASGSRFVGAINFAALAVFVLAAAYTRRDLAARLLRRNDISYGVYLFHLPVLNLLLVAGVGGPLGVALTCVLAIPVALLSWFAIEKPALRLRPRTIYAHG